MMTSCVFSDFKIKKNKYFTIQKMRNKQFTAENGIKSVIQSFIFKNKFQKNDI